MDHADPRRRFAASTFSCVSYSPLIFWFLSHRRFSTHFSRNVVSQNFRNFRFVPERLAQKSELSLHQMAVRAFFGQKKSELCFHQLAVRTTFGQKIRAERLSNGYPSQGPTEPPLHRNSALLVEAHWSVASSGRGITPDFGPRPLCVLESSCLLLSRTATHGQSPSACVDKPDQLALSWRSHLRREALAPEALSAQTLSLTCAVVVMSPCLHSRPCAHEASLSTY